MVVFFLIPKPRTSMKRILPLGIVFLLLAGVVESRTQVTAFTYQGRLDDAGSAANGVYDFEFALFDVAGGGVALDGPLTTNGVPVSNGLFTVTLDFGSDEFNGIPVWLEIGVRTNGGGAFTTLTPRQALTSVPYAIHAGTMDGSGILGVLPGGSLSGGYFNNVQFTDPGNQFFGDFFGDGAGLLNVTANFLNGKTDADFWQLAGNAGTSSTDFVGTTDNQALEIRVNNERALRIEPMLPTANLIGGHANNVTAPAVGGAVIAGGGSSGAINQVNGSFAVIGGGRGNFATMESAVGGGYSNRATGVRSVVAGGTLNFATNGLAVVSGGALNVASGMASVVAGGGGTDPNTGFDVPNQAAGHWSAVGGGRDNTAGGESATVSGGDLNTANGNQATVGGGTGNESRGEYTTVGGGAFNQADFPAATVSGGLENAALNMQATVGGGVGNYALGEKSTIGGGANNLSTGPHTTVPGGQQANPTQHGQLAHAAGMFVNPGDAQRSVYVLRARTDLFVPKARLALDGGGTLLRIEPNNSLTFDILVVARAEPPLTDTAGYHFRGVVKNTGGTTAFVGLPTATTLGDDTGLWSATLALVGDALTVDVDGGAGAGYPATVRWVGRVDAAQVSW
jgi:hypothetical protein